MTLDESVLAEERELVDRYREMAADVEREAEALEWCEGLISDVADEEE